MCGHLLTLSNYCGSFLLLDGSFGSFAVPLLLRFLPLRFGDFLQWLHPQRKTATMEAGIVSETRTLAVFSAVAT
jgi:hypothetical protein